jgi:hypothetical protein
MFQSGAERNFYYCHNIEEQLFTADIILRTDRKKISEEV